MSNDQGSGADAAEEIDEPVIDAQTAAEVAPQGVHADLFFDDLDPDFEAGAPAHRTAAREAGAEDDDVLAAFLADDIDVDRVDGPSSAKDTTSDGGDDADASSSSVLADAAATVAGIRTTDDGSSRAGWAYLGLLTLISAALISWAIVTEESAQVVPESTATTEVAGASAPAVVNLVVNGGAVSLQGEVPDQGAIDQLFALAEARYGEGNVTNELTINPAVTLTGGVVNVLGSAEEGDDGPNGLQSDVSAAFGFRAGDFDLTRTEAELTSVRASAVVGAGQVELSGAFPDRASADNYIVAAEQIFGAENVSFAGVTVDSGTTLNGGLFGISGLVDAGDTRASEFEARVLAFFGGSRADTSGLQIDTSPEALARLEERLRQEVSDQPILFASGSAELDESSDAILTSIAESIIATPGVDVEIVGHTDGEGAVEINQEISERRARAVLERLIELGVDESRLRARGAGESEPIGDNDTEEGRAVNRRIAFEFDGAG